MYKMPHEEETLTALVRWFLRQGDFLRSTQDKLTSLSNGIGNKRFRGRDLHSAVRWPISILISYSELPIITCSDFSKGVGPFFKYSSIACFIPYNDVPSGFLIIMG